jgi:DNA-binding Lrp family transcriptional regulator
MDNLDRKILRIVQRNCQLKAESIAEEVGLSASAVQRRLRQLRQDRVITSEIAVVDMKQIGGGITFIAGLEIERENYDALHRLRLWAAQNDSIQQLFYVTGSVDLIAIITARDVTEYDEIAAQIMRENSQIRRINTNVVLKSIKTGLFVPVPDIEEAE